MVILNDIRASEGVHIMYLIYLHTMAEVDRPVLPIAHEL